MIRSLLLILRRDLRWSLFITLMVAFSLFHFFATHGFRISVENTLKSRIKNALGADLSLSSRLRLEPQSLTAILTDIPLTDQTLLTEFFSMVTTDTNSKLVLVRAIDSHFPLIKKGYQWSDEQKFGLVKTNPQVVIDQDLAEALNLKVNDSLQLGQLSLTVSNILLTDPTQTLRMGNLAPRLYIHRDLLPATGLIGYGATITETLYFNLTASADLTTVKNLIQNRIKELEVQLVTPDEVASNQTRPLQIMGDFLSLISLGSLILLNIGLFYLARLHFNRRLTWITLQSTLGEPSHRIQKLLVVELLTLLLVGATIGILMALLIMPKLANWLPIKIEFTFTWGPLMGLTSLLTLLICLIPISYLLPWVRSFNLGNGLAALRDQLSYPYPKLSWAQKALFLISPFYLVGFSFIVAPSWQLISIFAATIISLTFIIYFIGRWLFKYLAKHEFGLLLHLISKRLSRAYFHFGIVMVTISICILFFMLPWWLSLGLKSELKVTEDLRPKLFAFDISEEELPTVKQFANEAKLTLLNPSPLLRARLLKINQKDFYNTNSEVALSREAQTEQRFRNRGLNITVRNQLTSSETLVAGKPFNQDTHLKKNLVSLEERYAQRMGINLYDTLTLDFQGESHEFYVSQIRRIKWNSFMPNFFIQIPSQIVDHLPKTWLMGINFDNSLLTVKDLQTQWTKQFSSSSLIDVQKLIDQILNWSDELIQVISLSSLLQIFLGLMVLIFLILIEFQNRKNEFALYPYLGLRAWQINSLIFIETLVLLTLATGISLIFCYLVTQSILVTVFG